VRHPRFIAGDFDTKFIEQEYRPEAIAAAAGEDATRVAAMMAAVVIAQRGMNHASAGNHASAPTQRAAGSPWKTLGRLDMLRR